MLHIQRLDLHLCTQIVATSDDPRQLHSSPDVRVFRPVPQKNRPQANDLFVFDIAKECHSVVTLRERLNVAAIQQRLDLAQMEIERLESYIESLPLRNDRHHVLSLLSECLRFFGMIVVFPELKIRLHNSCNTTRQRELIRNFHEWHDCTSYLKRRATTDPEKNNRKWVQNTVWDIVEECGISVPSWLDLYDLNRERNDLNHPPVTLNTVNELLSDASLLGNNRDRDVAICLIEAMQAWIHPSCYTIRSGQSIANDYWTHK